ncbi:hypothetical protein [Amycolatopsis rifamycinica]|uniref:Uncharacterized protein n=1 Tax=Amycolatopsis rifamycinica TaxID=287986 RepID=A0A066TW93_9PSEU|nr:hypothetical protein [Amycolatopsis rifamycinica]KDN19466.1 hypothetical protein DV20_25210 [Amycolatopsis rifamycinica]
MNRLMVFLDTIRDHLDLHQLPPVATLTVRTWSDPLTVQLDAHRLSDVAGALLTWANTLDDVAASLWRTSDGDSVHLSITGRTPCGIPVHVYSGVHFDPAVFPDLPAGARQDMPVFQLRQWTRPGEVAA